VSEKTGIAWTDSTWNVVTGCTKISQGCAHCYAELTAARLQRMGSKRYRDGFAVRFHPDVLREPMKWRAPRRIFVCSMADLFHKDVTDRQRAAIWCVMASRPDHTFQVLTKRAQEMKRWFSWLEEMATKAADVFPEDHQNWRRAHVLRAAAIDFGIAVPDYAFLEDQGWPLRNVEVGVTVENEEQAEARLLYLMACPAAVRFASLEPLLEDVDLTPWLDERPGCDGGAPHEDCEQCYPATRKLDWAIVGGESGPDARPMHPDWVRSVRDQCHAAMVPVFLKQWGAYRPKAAGEHYTGKLWGVLDRDGDWFPQTTPWNGNVGEDSETGEVRMVGSETPHALLEIDGKTWAQFPLDAGEFIGTDGEVHSL
jgi:protein gp37